MNEETQFIGKPGKVTGAHKLKMAGESQFGGITVRGYLALLLIVTLCLVNLCGTLVAVMQAYYEHKFTALTVDAGFMTIVGTALAHYFTQRGNVPATPPAAPIAPKE